LAVLRRSIDAEWVKLKWQPKRKADAVDLFDFDCPENTIEASEGRWPSEGERLVEKATAQVKELPGLFEWRLRGKDGTRAVADAGMLLYARSARSVAQCFGERVSKSEREQGDRVLRQLRNIIDAQWLILHWKPRNELHIANFVEFHTARRVMGLDEAGCLDCVKRLSDETMTQSGHPRTLMQWRFRGRNGVTTFPDYAVFFPS
jgi:hypothetical protein